MGILIRGHLQFNPLILLVSCHKNGQPNREETQAQIPIPFPLREIPNFRNKIKEKNETR
jgi:hypothetical protein